VKNGKPPNPASVPVLAVQSFGIQLANGTIGLVVNDGELVLAIPAEGALAIGHELVKAGLRMSLTEPELRDLLKLKSPILEIVPPSLIVPKES
jgi:hypothetical protein